LYLLPAGIQKGDRVAIYMPMILELVVAMLACARLGALHSIVVGVWADEKGQGLEIMF
jgi:acetyl-CoA synthetase